MMNAPKIYGLDKIKKESPVLRYQKDRLTHVPIKNSIAMCGADGDVYKWGVSTPVWVYDNEPRSKEIVKRISNTIDRGDKVVIWPI